MSPGSTRQATGKKPSRFLLATATLKGWLQRVVARLDALSDEGFVVIPPDNASPDWLRDLPPDMLLRPLRLYLYQETPMCRRESICPFLRGHPGLAPPIAQDRPMRASATGDTMPPEDRIALCADRKVFASSCRMPQFDGNPQSNAEPATSAGSGQASHPAPGGTT